MMIKKLILITRNSGATTTEIGLVYVTKVLGRSITYSIRAEERDKIDSLRKNWRNWKIVNNKSSGTATCSAQCAAGRDAPRQAKPAN